MRKITYVFFCCFLFLLLFVKAGFASPLNDSTKAGKAHNKNSKNVHKVLFPTHLDHSATSPSFLLLSPNKNENNYSEPLGNLSMAQLLAAKRGEKISRGYGSLPLAKKLFLEGNSMETEKNGSNIFQNAQDYSRILKTSSLGFAYPLTSKLTLDGKYAMIKREGMNPSTSPYFSATYRFNTTTSISLSYPDLSEDNKAASTATSNQTKAELKVHF